MKIAIVTSIFNYDDYQPLHRPNTVFGEADYFAFLDKRQPVTGWNQIISPSFSLDESYRGRRDAKIYKILPHLFLKDYDFWIWTDPTHEVTVNPVELCKMLGDKEIGVFKHTSRTCAYEEALEVNRLKYDHPRLLRDQLDFYRNRGFPQNYGLYELPTFVRKNTDKVQAMNMRWWELICRYSSRDQISFPFILWSMSIDPYIFDGFANGGLNANQYIPQTRYKFS